MKRISALSHRPSSRDVTRTRAGSVLSRLTSSSTSSWLRTPDSRAIQSPFSANSKLPYSCFNSQSGNSKALVGPPPGEFLAPIFEVVLGRITICGSIVGRRQDLVEAIAFAAERKVHSHIQKMKLEDNNEEFANLKAGKIDGRMVMTF